MEKSMKRYAFLLATQIASLPPPCIRKLTRPHFATLLKPLFSFQYLFASFSAPSGAFYVALRAATFGRELSSLPCAIQDSCWHLNFLVFHSASQNNSTPTLFQNTNAQFSNIGMYLRP